LTEQEKLKKINKLLDKYYDTEIDDDFGQTANELIGYMGFLVNTAEKFYPKDDLNLEEQLAEAKDYIERQKEYIKQLEEDDEELKNSLSMAQMALTFATDPTI
jgi:hypothetical protein